MFEKPNISETAYSFSRSIHVSSIMEPTDRESILKEEIDRDPGISTTDLQNRVQGYMAKDTASKILGDLVGDGKIIQRKEGKKIRYFPLDAEEGELNKSLAAALDVYVKDLCAMKDEMKTYPYDLLNMLNNTIPRQREELMRRKKGLEDDMKFEHTVKDIMRVHSEICDDIYKSLGMFQKLVDDDTERKIRECLTVMSSRLRQNATRRFELINKRKHYGKSETRYSLTEEIDNLTSDMDKIQDRTAELDVKLRYLKRAKPRELWGPLAPQPVYQLQRVEEERTRLQGLVEEALNAKANLQGDELEHWQKAEDGLIRIREQLSDMKDGLAEAQEVVIASYIDADLYEQQKKLYSLVEETFETYRS